MTNSYQILAETIQGVVQTLQILAQSNRDDSDRLREEIKKLRASLDNAKDKP